MKDHLSMFQNFEWENGFSTRFDLVHVKMAEYIKNPTATSNGELLEEIFTYSQLAGQ